MTRSSILTCGMCGKPTTTIVVKLYKTDTNSRRRGRMDANNYTHHADVGICCIGKLGQIRWNPRRERQSDAA